MNNLIQRLTMNICFGNEAYGLVPLGDRDFHTLT